MYPYRRDFLACWINDFACSSVRDLDGRPAVPVGTLASEATLRPTRSLASAMWIARTSALRAISSVRVDRSADSSASADLTWRAVRSRSLAEPINVVSGSSTSRYADTVFAERPSRLLASQSSTACLTVYVADVFGPSRSSSCNAWSFVFTSVLLWPLTLRRTRLPSGAEPSEITPRQRPAHALCSRASKQAVPTR